jgi:3-isopropylmalate dehydrogenase
LGEPLPAAVLEACRDSDAILLGAVGDPKFDDYPPHLRPEKALLRLRKELELFANLRPIRTFSVLVDASTLKREVVEGVDILIVRELPGGIYFGEPRGLETRSDGRMGYNTEIYHDNEIDRIPRGRIVGPFRAGSLWLETLPRLKSGLQPAPLSGA